MGKRVFILLIPYIPLIIVQTKSTWQKIKVEMKEREGAEFEILLKGAVKKIFFNV